MRTYGTPALTAIAPSASLTDVVFRRAATEPDAVMLRRRSDGGGWRDVTASQFCAEVTALAAGLAVAGIEPGDCVAVNQQLALGGPSALRPALTSRWPPGRGVS